MSQRATDRSPGLPTTATGMAASFIRFLFQTHGEILEGSKSFWQAASNRGLKPTVFRSRETFWIEKIGLNLFYWSLEWWENWYKQNLEHFLSKFLSCEVLSKQIMLQSSRRRTPLTSPTQPRSHKSPLVSKQIEKLPFLRWYTQNAIPLLVMLSGSLRSARLPLQFVSVWVWVSVFVCNTHIKAGKEVQELCSDI